MTLFVFLFGIAAWYIGYLIINSFSHANFELKSADGRTIHYRRAKPPKPTAEERQWLSEIRDAIKDEYPGYAGTPGVGCLALQLLPGTRDQAALIVVGPIVIGAAHGPRAAPRSLLQQPRAGPLRCQSQSPYIAGGLQRTPPRIQQRARVAAGADDPRHLGGRGHRDRRAGE